MGMGSSDLLMLAAGTVLACQAERYSAWAARIELVAGMLIVGGLSMIGTGVGWAFNWSPFAAP